MQSDIDDFLDDLESSSPINQKRANESNRESERKAHKFLLLTVLVSFSLAIFVSLGSPIDFLQREFLVSWTWIWIAVIFGLPLCDVVYGVLKKRLRWFWALAHKERDVSRPFERKFRSASREPTDLNETRVSATSANASDKPRKVNRKSPFYVVQYEELDGTLKKKWYAGISDAKAGHKWFKKAAKLGKYQNVYPPMEEAAPEIDDAPETRKEIAAFLSQHFRDGPV